MIDKRIRTSLLAAFVMATVSGIAYAGTSSDASPESHPGKQAGMHERMRGHGAAPLMGTLRQLGLTEAQQQSVRSIIDGSSAQRAALRDQRRINTESRASTLPDDPNYPALIESQKRLASDAIQQRSDVLTQIYSVLTPQQQAQVPQLLADRKARMEQRRQARLEKWRSRHESSGSPVVAQ
jgi:Spy/CpxP family protein refolding chaperone